MSVLKGDYKRIVSTVPSQTELLYDLGLEEVVVGITAYCVHPAHWLREKKVIGGTKDLNIKLIMESKPGGSKKLLVLIKDSMTYHFSSFL